MAQLERLHKSFEALRISINSSKFPKNVDKSQPSLRFLKQDIILNKNDYIHHCNTIADTISLSSIRNNDDFPRLLATSVEICLISCDDDDPDIRLAAGDAIDKICLALFESNLNRIQVELYREIEKNGSSRTLRVALNKFSELCSFIRPSKYRPFASKIFPCIMKIIYRTDDELLQETLMQFISKICPVLGPYATDKEIVSILNAYLPNLNCSSSVIRRSVALSMVILCEHTRRPHQFFQLLMNNLLNLLSTVKVSNSENSEKLFSGIFIVVKFLCPKVMILLQNSERSDTSIENYEMMFENLIFMYQHLLTSIKYSTSNVVIVSALEALIEYINSLPYKIYQRIVNLNQSDEFRLNWSHSRSPTALSTVLRNDKKYESNLSITSSINYIENINDDFNEELFKKSGISLLDTRSELKSSSDFVSEYGDSEMDDNDVYSEINFDQESELDHSLQENKINEFDDVSEYSSANYKNNLGPSDFNIENIDISGSSNQINIDHFSLGPLYSLEYASKLICLKFLLQGEDGQLVPDEVVRVSIKSLALSCFSSLVHIYPEALFLRVSTEQKSQSFVDLLLYASHSDPNIKGCIAIIIGKFFDKVLSLPISYSEFVSQNFAGDPNSIEFSSLLSALIGIAQDLSSISIKQALISFKLFLPKLLKCNELNYSEIMNIFEMLISLKNNPYWLVKVELVHLLSSIPYNSAIYLEQNMDRSNRTLSFSKRIVEEIIFFFAFDNDHRVRQAVISSLARYIENLCLNTYLLSNDPINVNIQESMLSYFHYQHNSKLFNGSFPGIESFISPLDYNHKVDSVFSIGILGNLNHLNLSSNLLYFVKRFIFELSHNYNRKSLFGAINALSFLAKVYPPSSNLEAWQIECQNLSQSNNSLGTVNFLIELLTKNQSLMLDLTAHQNLIALIADLLEGFVCCGVKQLLECPEIKVQSEGQLFNQISPNFLKCAQLYFIHLLKIVVAHSAIAEENSAIFITFIHNLHSKNQSSLAALLKRRSGKFYYLKEKDNTALKKELSNKGSKKQESLAYDPLYHRLFDLLKSFHRNKKVSISNKSDRYSLLSTTLNSMSKLLEIIDFSFVLNYLEDFLIYLKLVFYLDPTSTILTVKQLLKCIFGVNYVSLFVDYSNDQTNGEPPLNQPTDDATCGYKWHDINSLYNSCLSIPYIKLNDFYKTYRTRCHSSQSNGAFLTWLKERIYLKLSKTLNLNTDIDMISDSDMKKVLSNKIQFFEPLVIKSLKYYTNTSDHKFQAQVAELLAQLVQLHVNYCVLDSDNIFINFITKQFEFLENVTNSSSHEPLMKRLFYFMVILSNGHYISEDLIAIPKVIQLCDGLIANGHHQLALEGLYIILDDIFYYKNEDNVDSFADLETQREVVLAYCFKLLDFYQSFDLLVLIVNYYKNSNPTKWTNLSIQIVDLLSCKLAEGTIRLDSLQSLECLQSLIYSLCPTAFSSIVNLVSHLFSKHQDNGRPLSFVEWFAKTSLFLKLTLFNLNESELLSKTEDIRSSIDISILSTIDQSKENTNCDSVATEDLFSNFLLGTLQMAVVKLHEDLRNYRLKSDNFELIIYLLSQYNLSLTFIFQSGFYPKITNSATTLIRSTSVSIAVNEVVFDLFRINELFLNLAILLPNLTISWLNLLYILNYEKLLETLSKLIERATCEHSHSVGIHLQTVKRFSLILLCDYLTENLENVEFLSWLIINHLREIVDLCNEMPVKEFINSIHRKSSSSGLFLQAINSRCGELLCNPLFASKVLQCLERAHSSQSIPLIMFLLDKFLFNKQIAVYYNCSKYAETIVSNRLISLYDLNLNRLHGTEEISRKNLLSLKDVNNLKKVLKNTSYVKLNFTVQMIKNKFFDIGRRKKSVVIKDPLTDQRNVVPEINKKWFVDILKQYWSFPQSNLANAIYFLNKLSSEDIAGLLNSCQFLIQNQKQILIFLLEKIPEKRSFNHKLKSFNSDANRNDLTKQALQMSIAFMQYIMHRFPLATFISERKVIPQSQLFQIQENEQFVNICFSFLPPFEYLMCNLAILEEQANLFSISNSSLDVNLLIVYSCCLYHTYRSNDLVHLMDLLALIKTSLHNQTLFGKLSKPDHINLQLSLIDSIYYIMSHCYDLRLDIKLPSELTNFGHSSFQFEHIFENISKMLLMFHCLETQACIKLGEHFPPILQNILQNIVLQLARLPFVNSLIYVPFSLYCSKQENYIWKEISFNGDFHTNIPIVNAHHLMDLDLFKQFSFRISSIGFVNRIQFEEIWMTLLGVFSENLTMMNQTKNEDDLKENILHAQLVIRALTILLQKTKSSKTCSGVGKTSKQSFGDRFELIRDHLHKKSNELINNWRLYNKTHMDANMCISDYSSVESLQNKLAGSILSPQKLSPEADSENSIDLYSCLHFLVDLYLQTVQTIAQKNSIYFPMLTEIAKSCLLLSDMFVDKIHFHILLQILNELAKIVDYYEDEILSQFVIVALAKSHAVLSLTGETIERHKKLIIEQYFKDFFLPTRIGAVRSIKFLLSCPNLVSSKDLLSIWEYIGKHFDNELCIPSSYSAEYVEELWSLSFCLIERYSTHAVGLEFNDKVFKALQKNLVRSKKFTNLRVVCTGLERLLCSSHVTSKEVVAINSSALKQMKTCTNQANMMYLLNLYVLSSYLLGPSNLNAKAQLDNDELFMTMEQLSIIFDPLKSCNSLEANIICQVMGHFLVDFFPAQDLLNKCIGEFLSNQQNHYKYLTDILFVIFNKFQNDFQHNDTAQDWVILSLSSFTQLIPISHALWALTCFLMSASQNHWIRASYPYFQNRFGQFNERDKRSFFTICNNFYNEIKSNENKKTFIKTFQKAACVPNSPYFDVLKYLCDI